MKKFIALLLLLLSIGILTGAAIIPDARRIEWSTNVGIIGGIPAVTTIYTNFTSAASFSNVDTAFSNCPSNQVIQLGAWTNSWEAGVDLQGRGQGQVLRGTTNSAGYPLTKIIITNGYFLIRGQFALPNVQSNVSVNVVKGTNTVYFAATPSWLVAGELYFISQLDDSAYVEVDGLEGGRGPLHYTVAEERGMCQLDRCVSTTGTSATFEIPMSWDYATSRNASVAESLYNYGNSRPRKVGFEDLIIEGGYTDGNADTLRFENADQCWVKNVVITNQAGRDAIELYSSYRCEVKHCWITGSHAYDAGQGYGVAHYNGSTGCLIQDNVFTNLHLALDFSFSCHGNAICYNYVGDGQSISHQNGAFVSHGCHNWMNLVEGNFATEKVSADITHGSASHYTIFRNRLQGTGTSFDHNGITMQAYNRFGNCAGNIIGQTNFHTFYDGAPSGAQTDCSADGVIFQIGCATPNDSVAVSQMLREVNSVFTNGSTSPVLINGSFTTNDLVSSYVFASKPAYFGILNWPPYDPTMTISTASITNIPAGHRFAFGFDPPAASGGNGNGPPRLAKQVGNNRTRR